MADIPLHLAAASGDRPVKKTIVATNYNSGNVDIKPFYPTTYKNLTVADFGYDVVRATGSGEGSIAGTAGVDLTGDKLVYNPSTGILSSVSNAFYGFSTQYNPGGEIYQTSRCYVYVNLYCTK